MHRYTARRLLNCVMKYTGKMAESVSGTHWDTLAQVSSTCDLMLQLLLIHFVSSVGFLLKREAR